MIRAPPAKNNAARYSPSLCAVSAHHTSKTISYLTFPMPIHVTKDIDKRSLLCSSRLSGFSEDVVEEAAMQRALDTVACPNTARRLSESRKRQ
jgi:hypothetical protein